MKRSITELKKTHTESSYLHPWNATDIIIEYHAPEKSGVVLIERLNPPYGLAIPGGFCELGLSYEDNAKKESKEETNLDIILLNPGRPYQYSDPYRDPRGHIVSNTFYAFGYGDLRAQSDAKKVGVYTLKEVQQLIEQEAFAFDHAKILSEWIENRGWKFEYEKIKWEKIRTNERII